MSMPFSYFAILSLVAKRPISLDGTATEMNALIAHLLGVESVIDPVSPIDMEKARERLFSQFPHLYPTGCEMVLHYGAMLECVEVVRTSDVRYFLLGWAIQTKNEMGLPETFDVETGF